MAANPFFPRSLPQTPALNFCVNRPSGSARSEVMQLAVEQRRLAQDYGYRNWAALISALEAMTSADESGSARMTRSRQVGHERAKAGLLLFRFCPCVD
jgi:hypothetical protein